jgi:23S rRNA pseudouridine2605 synthase
VNPDAPTAVAGVAAERLNRYLARSGVASRRDADSLIASGAVRVNGELPPASGMLVVAGQDQVTVQGRTVEPSVPHRYLAMNKPEGVLVTARDPQGRPTVFDAVRDELPGRLFAVGRLDVATSGLLLLTDDGELANRLAHPRHKVAKEYLAVVRGTPSEAAVRALREGLELDGRRTQPALMEIEGSAGGFSRLRIVIREGRYRQVRRMLEAIGHPVRELTRTAFGPIRLGRLPAGGWRKLKPAEVEALRRASGPAR